MKYYYLFLILIFIFGSCNQPLNPERHFISNEIKYVMLKFNRFDNGLLFWGNRMDDLPEDVLYGQEEFLDSCIISSTTEILNIQRLLSLSLLQEDSIESFDTEIVALVHYQDGKVDTLGIPQSVTRGFFYKYQRYDNPTLIDLLIRLSDNQRAKGLKIVQQCHWKEDYKYYSAPIFDKSVYYQNYALFSGTKAEQLAQYMAMEKYDSIQLLLEKDSSLLYARDPQSDCPIVFQSIYFQQDTILRLFLEKGFNPNYRKSKQDSNQELRSIEPPLFIACGNSYYNKCGYLLVEYGADVNLCIPSLYAFSTPLHVAIMQRNYEMAKYLIENGANIEIEGKYPYNDDSGMIVEEAITPLDLALKMRYFKMAYFLLCHGANPQTLMIERYGGLYSFMNHVDIKKTMPSDRPYIQNIIELSKNQE